MSILGLGASLYGAAAVWRRRWYVRHPERRRHPHRPVISIGNLSVGGTGKTPITAALARLLIAQGESPSILSRGYRRAVAPKGVTIVSNGRTIRATLDTAGDEPLMLARALQTVPVLVGRNRYVSARFAEERLGVTVHLLDDGFQHLELVRDVDLLVVRPEDLGDRVLPAGRLREPVTVASVADAVLVHASRDAAAEDLARSLGVATWFRVERRLGEPWWFTNDDGTVAPGTRVVGVAGVARPDAFFQDLSARGWGVVATLPFPDHHRFSIDDTRRIETTARSAGAIVMTTEKDAVRLEGCGFGRVPIAVLPLEMGVEPEARFTGWLVARLAAVRGDGTSPVPGAPRADPGAAPGA